MNRKERTQETARLLLNLLIIGILSLFFIVVWYRYYRDTVYYYRRGNYLITAIYAVLLIVFNSVYGGFQIGYAKTSDLIFSQSLSIAFTNFIIYMIGTLVNKKFLHLQGYWLFILAQIGITIVLNILLNQIYYRVFPAKNTLLIYGEEDQSLYDRILAYQSNSYDITKKLQFEEFKNNIEALKDYYDVCG